MASDSSLTERFQNLPPPPQWLTQGLVDLRERTSIAFTRIQQHAATQQQLWPLILDWVQQQQQHITDRVTHRKQQRRIQHPYVDGSKGLLAVIVVFYHAQCMFHPCRAFGPTAAMVQDIAVCDETSDSSSFLQLVLWNPLTNGEFCSCVFYVLSGFLLSHSLWKASVDEWRVAVSKRFFRLVSCWLAAALLGKLILSLLFYGSSELREITRSRWLEQDFSIRPSFLELPFQVLGSIWNGTSSNGVAGGTISTFLSFELLGSYLTFGLVLLLKTSPHRIRTRWLGALFIALLIPNATVFDTLETRVAYNVAQDQRLDSSSGATNVRRIVSLNTADHLYLLDHSSLHRRRRSVTKNPPALTMEFLDTPSGHWHKHTTPTAPVDQTTRYDLDSATINSELDNVSVEKEVRSAVDGTHSMILDPSIELERRSVWTTENAWLVYASFVAGIWISEMYLSGAAASMESSATTATWGILPSESLKTIAAWILPLVSFLCASYPRGAASVPDSGLWTGMLQIAGLFGYSAGGAMSFWCTLGATSLTMYLVFFGDVVREKVLGHPSLTRLGRLSFPLFLTHMPILLCMTSPLFVAFYKQFDEDTTWSFILAMALSIPVMLAVAHSFQHVIDIPAQHFSDHFGRVLVGILDQEEGRSSTGDRSAEIEKPPRREFARFSSIPLAEGENRQHDETSA